MMRSKAVLSLLAVALFASSASALVHDLTATIDCAQADMGLGTCGAGGTGMGSATVSYDDSSNLLSWNVSWSGLSGTISAMHFHGPATPDQSAGVRQNIGGVSGLTSPSIGSATITSAFGQELLDRLWYINIHSLPDFGGGEIRGQVVPEPATSTLVAFGLLGTLAGFARCRPRRE